MGNIFLSASIPVPGRGDFHEDADPFLIQFAVRELFVVALGRRRIVWGGHPAITPMVWAICEDLGVEYANAVTLYQSRLFKAVFPEENARFANVIEVEAVDEDRDLSLIALRKTMLDREYEAAVFIGGMDGLLHEYELFKQMHPQVPILAVGSTGGAAKQIARWEQQDVERIDFLQTYMDVLQIDCSQKRGLAEVAVAQTKLIEGS